MQHPPGVTDLDDPGQPAELLFVYGRRTVRRRRYQTGHESSNVGLRIGWIDDGRWWWADITRHREGRIFRTEQGAFAAVDRYWSRPQPEPGEWIEVPAEYGDTGHAAACWLGRTDRTRTASAREIGRSGTVSICSTH